MALRFRTDLPRRGRSLQRANVEAARRDWHALIKQDQTDEQNETSEREIDRDLPRGRAPVPAAPNSDQQKGWDKREFVEPIKEKEIERRKRAARADGDEQKGGLKRVFVIVELAGEPNGRQRDDCGEQ